MAISQQQLESLYLAYFGRPADFDGLVFYTSNPAFDIWSVAAAFSASPESQALYGSGTDLHQISASTINAIYQNLFNRDAEPAGLLYWSTEVASGRLTAAGAAYAIYLGAQNADKVTVTNKMAASAAFTTALDTAPEIIGYAGQDAAALARAQLHTVTSDPATLTAYIANISAEVAAVVAVGGVIGVSKTLTTDVDTINFTGNVTTIDTVHGVVDPGGTSTLSVGDTITGNGKTIVDIAVAGAGTSDFTTLTNVNKVNITAATSSWVDLNASGWTGIGSVNLTKGVDGLNVYLTNLNKGASLSIANVTGTLSTTYTNHIWTEIGATGASGSSISYVGGVVTGTLAAGSTNEVWFSQSATADGVSQTVGNITIAAAAGGGGTDAWASISNTQDVGGDITVGNVAISGAKYDWLSITNTDHTASSAAVNTTVGNVTITSTVASGWVGLDIDQSSAGPTGNVKVGDVVLTANAKSASVSLTVSNSGVKTAGNTTIGNVTLSANGANGTVDMYVTNYASAGGTKAATAGDLTIGNVVLSATGLSGYVYASVTNEAYDSGSGAAKAGNVTVGTVNVSVGQSGTASVSVSNYAYSSTGKATVGNLTTGAATFNLAVDASADYSISITADAGTAAAATVGNVSVGSITENVGIGASMTYYMYADAYGTSASSIGTVSVGSITANVDDGGYAYNYVYEYSQGTAGAVHLGDQVATLGVSATNYFYNYVYGTYGVDSVTVGNITGDASKLSGYFYDYNYFSATSGDLGNVSVGNVTLLAGKSATADAYVYAVGETSVGTVTVGNVTESAVGANASANFSVTSYVSSAAGSAGAMTIGNVSLTANGASAYNWFYASQSGAAGATGGLLTVGNVSITVGNAAKATGALASFSVDNALGAVKVGNIAITAASVRGTTDTLMSYDENIVITAATSVTVGNISVSGSTGGGANNFNVFTNLLTLNAGTTKTIGNVDYSGFTSAATIDVSGFKGAASVTGGTKGDTITDNTGVNSLTGGSGADTFTFVTGNKGVTAATADVITDFNNTAGDKITVFGGFAAALNPDTNYGEGSFADFATFQTAANAGNKEVYVGQIGADSYLAIDAANDGTIDFYVKLVGVSTAGIDVASFV